MSHSALVDEVANELETWPGVRIEVRPDRVAVVLYEQLELGVLDPEEGVAELRFAPEERDQLVEHGDAEPAADDDAVIHDVHGPSDVAAVLALFDRRYRDVRGEGEPYSSQDPPAEEPYSSQDPI